MYNAPYNQSYPQTGQQAPPQPAQIDPRAAAGIRIVQAYQQMKDAPDPAQYLVSLITQSPQAAQTVQLIKGKDSRQLGHNRIDVIAGNYLY